MNLFAKIVGYLSVALGILWVLKPEFLRGWFTRKANWQLFWLAFGILFYPLAHYGKRWGLLGVVALFIAFWMVMKMARASVKELFLKIPLIAFQGVGVLNILFGCLLIYKN